MSRAEKYIDDAADQGANIVVFPENFPGPWFQSDNYSPKERMQKKAAQRKVYTIFGDLERMGEEEDAPCYNIFWFVGPDGQVIGKYRRTTPGPPWVYKNGNYWRFNYTVGDELPVFDTEYGKVGILMCSEVYAPELSRVLAVKGAEMIFIPAGKPGAGMWGTWSTLIKARAHENLAFTGVCRNIFTEDEEGLCVIAGPEGTLLETHKGGIHMAELDMERMRWLRANEDKLPYPPAWHTKPGQFFQWRRPELYAELVKPLKPRG